MTYRRFGIQYCSTDEFSAFGTSAGPYPSLYGSSLLPDQGSSVLVRVFRNQTASSDNTLARLEVTYYITYKGNKGASSLTQA